MLAVVVVVVVVVVNGGQSSTSLKASDLTPVIGNPRREKSPCWTPAWHSGVMEFCYS